MTNSQIIAEESEYNDLLKEVFSLKEHITMLTALRDDLIYHVCPALRAEYEEKVGCLERELLAAQLYLREKQRVIEILQAQINRRMQPSMEEAKQKARAEFKDYREDLKNKTKQAEEFQRHWKEDSGWFRHDREDRRTKEDRIEKDDSRGGKKESPAEELKRLYRKIVKLLHPDVHSNPTEREKDLLNRANVANARGDLEKMRAIWRELSGMCVKEEEYSDTPEGLARMRELIGRLKARRHALEEEIARIKAKYPYTMKSFLADQAAVEEKRVKLQEQIELVREEDRRLADYIEELRSRLSKDE